MSYSVLRRGKTTFIWKKANCQPEYKNVSKNLGQSSSSPHSVFCIVYPSICLTHEIPHAGMEFLLRGLEIGGRERRGGREKGMGKGKEEGGGREGTSFQNETRNTCTSLSFSQKGGKIIH